MFSLSWEIKIEHIFKETNECVDELTNYSCIKLNSLVVFEQSPPTMGALVLTDCMGISIPHHVASRFDSLLGLSGCFLPKRIFKKRLICKPNTWMKKPKLEEKK